MLIALDEHATPLLIRVTSEPYFMSTETLNDTSYTDEKGRLRWRRNDQIAVQLKEMGEFLVVGGYEASHAARYPKLAHAISRYPESVVELDKQGRLREIPGIGETIAGIISEMLATGTCRKIEEWAEHTPKSVVEMTRIPGLGALTVRSLFQDYGIRDLKGLEQSLAEGHLSGVKGLGKKTLENIQQHLSKITIDET